MKKNKRVNNLKFLTTLSLISLAPISVTLTSCGQSSTTNLTDCVNLINALNDESSEEEVIAARKSYDKLSEEDKNLVPLSTLNNLIEQENRIKNSKEAEKVIALINGLNEDSTLEEIQLVKDKYNALNPSAKNLVTNYSRLIELQTIAKDKKAAKEFEQFINKYDLTNLSEQDIKDIEAQYLLLNEQAKGFLSIEAKNKFEIVQETLRKPAKDLNKEMEDLLAIKEKDQDLFIISFEAKTNELLNRYKEIKDEYKPLVTNYESLVDASKLFGSVFNLLEDNSIKTSGYTSTSKIHPTNAEESIDSTYGKVYNLTLNASSASEKTLDIDFTNEVPFAKLKNLTKMFFYFYSPLEGGASMNLVFADANGNRIGDVETMNVIHGWNKIEIDRSKIATFKTSLVGICSNTNKFNVSSDTGFKMSPVYMMEDRTIEVNDVLSKIATSLSEVKTDIEKLQNLSKYEYSQKLINKLSQEEKDKLDNKLIDSLTATYSQYGTSLYGFKDEDTLSPINGEQGEYIVSIERDSESAFAQNYGEVYKATFKEQSKQTTHIMNCDNLKGVSFEGYSKISFVVYNDLYKGTGKETSGNFADKAKFIDWTPNVVCQQGITGYGYDIGYGKGITLVTYDLSNTKSKTFDLAQMMYQNQWGPTDVGHTHFYFTSIFALK